MNVIEEYLRELHEIRSSGSALKETSYYPALSNLLHAVGLKPRVRCVINIRNRGAGIPDGGLFSADQLQRSTGGEVPDGTSPSLHSVEPRNRRKSP